MRYKAEDYQKTGIRFLIERDHAGLFCDPGGGKTAMTLAAFVMLRKLGIVKRALIIAPRLVCYNTWPDEIAKWDQFADLTWQIMHGDRKADKLHRAFSKNAPDISIINPDGVRWLFENINELPRFPWDMLIVDESSKFKNPGCQRFKLLRKMISRFKRRVILTGTPAPNGLLDLWSQQFILDQGASLGVTMSLYKTYKIKGEDEKRAIYNRIAPSVLRFDAETFSTLPELLIHDVPVRLDAAARAEYDKAEKDLMFAIDTDEPTLPPAGASAYLTCRQMANGRAYMPAQDGETRRVHLCHGEKIEALHGLLDELWGKPALIAYYFRHDLIAIQEAVRSRGIECPHIGGDVLVDKINAHVSAWNRGELPVLVVHPQSMAHGLNLQAGGNDLIWYSLTDNLEDYQQLIKRLHRRGVRGQVRCHRIIARDTVDDVIASRLDAKAENQKTMLDFLRDYRAGKSA